MLCQTFSSLPSRRGSSVLRIYCAVIFSSICVLGWRAVTATCCKPGSVAVAPANSLPEGEVNQGYSASLSGSGGALPYTWSVSPALPANLSLDADHANHRRTDDAGNHNTHLRCATARPLRKPSNKRSA